MLVREQREFEAAIAVFEVIFHRTKLNLKLNESTKTGIDINWVSTNPPVSVHLFNRWTDNLQLYWLYFESTWAFGWCLLDLLSFGRAYIFLSLLLLLWIKGNNIFLLYRWASNSVGLYDDILPSFLIACCCIVPWAPKNLKAQTLDYDCDKSRIQKLLQINIWFIPEENSTIRLPTILEWFVSSSLLSSHHLNHPSTALLCPQRTHLSNGLRKVLHLFIPPSDVLGEAIKVQVPEILFQLHSKVKKKFRSLWSYEVGSDGKRTLKCKKESGVRVMYSGMSVCLADEEVP